MERVDVSLLVISLFTKRICSLLKLAFFLFYSVVAVLLIMDKSVSIDSFTPRLALITKRSSNYQVINHHQHHILRSSSSNESLSGSRILFEDVKHLLHNGTRTTTPFLYNDNSQEQHQLMMKIVQCGRLFGNNDSFDAVSKSMELRSPLTLVPGCVANVQVSTALIPIAESQNLFCASQYYVKLDGTADALISRGLLALISASLDNTTTHTIFPNKSYHVNRCRPTAQELLNIDPNTVADSLGLRSALSRGRNDGLASIITTVQNQIRTILLGNNVNSDNYSLYSTSASASIHDSTRGTQQNNYNNRTTVAMLLSGGVDSSVALSLLVSDPQYEVHAFYLKIWLEDELSHLGVCPWEEDWEMCQKVVAHLNTHCSARISLTAVSLQSQYHQHIINYTVHEARRGRTPNPDIMCNARVKFGCFLSEIMSQGGPISFDYVASGHYARVHHSNTGGSSKLFRAPDPIKDQSYFLSTLTQEQLNRVLFPIGNLTKNQVRSLAAEFNLPNKERPDSQGLCFLGKVKFDNFLQAYLGEQPGDVVDASTFEVIGQHRGLWFHTVGQRKRIGKYLFPKVTNQGPWFIVAKDPKNNVLFASNEFHDDDSVKAPIAASRSHFGVEDVRWISDLYPQDQMELLENGKLEGLFDMKIRHGPTIARGILSMDVIADNKTPITASKGRIQLEEKDWGLAPGQFVVFYEIGGEECLGSGVISEDHWSQFFLKQNKAEVTHHRESSCTTVS